MYDADIQTSINIDSFVIYLEYRVTAEEAVEWGLNPGMYGRELKVLEHFLRTWYSTEVEKEIIDDFQARLYAQEAAEAATYSLKEDIPF
jgi:hypothetical protein